MQRRPDPVERLNFKRLRRPRLSQPEGRRVQALARQFKSECRFAREQTYFNPYVQRGLGSGCMTIIGDVSEIPLLTIPESEALEYRLSSFAQTGDIVVLGRARNRDFERYREKLLHLGSPDYLNTCQPDARSLLSTPARCLKEAKTYSELVKLVRSREATTVLAHITTGTIWALARKLGKDSGRSMRVAGPLPTLSRLANNKLWFSKVAKTLLGPDAIPDEIPVYGAAALTGAVRQLAQHNNKLVIKVPDSAGSAGNFSVCCAEVKDMDVRTTHQFLANLLAPVEQEQHFPLMLQVWQNKVLMSPSVQTWIPEVQEGPPIIEGHYQQVLSGAKGEFSGAAPVILPPELDSKMARQAMSLALLFQALGYFGRCSFDAVVSGDDIDSAKLLWIECNGRWGGVSIPVTFLNSHFRTAQTPAFVIHHAPASVDQRQSFAEGCAKMKELLWSPGRNSGVIFLTPSGFESGENLHFIALAPTMERAQQQSDSALRLLADFP